MDPIDHVPGIVRRLYELVGELESHFPGRKFTPDGHLVGSLGEVLAAYYYDLELLTASTECHDAATRDGTRLVQVKATQGKSVGIRAEPVHLLVLLLGRDGTVEEVYNGPGAPAWARIGAPQKNGEFQLSVSTLRKLMSAVAPEERLPRRSV
jgi:hypothetical protein